MVNLRDVIGNFNVNVKLVSGVNYNVVIVSGN